MNEIKLFECYELNSSGASSGNSGELTTIKNLKRSKNKGRKKKAKTKQSQNQSNKTNEPSQETNTQDVTVINDESKTPIFAPPTLLIVDTTIKENITTDAEDSFLPVKPITGKLFYS